MAPVIRFFKGYVIQTYTVTINLILINQGGSMIRANRPDNQWFCIMIKRMIVRGPLYKNVQFPLRECDY